MSPILLSNSCLSHWNSSHNTRKCRTSSTSSLSHSTHLSSSQSLHLFLSANNPAKPVLIRKRHLIASCPCDDPRYVSTPNSSFVVRYHPKLLLLSTSSHQPSSLINPLSPPLFQRFIAQNVLCHGRGEVDFLEGIHRRFELWLPPADSEFTTREQTKPTCRLEGDL